MALRITFCVLAATWLAGSAVAVAAEPPLRSHVQRETLQALALEGLRVRAAKDGIEGVVFAIVGAPADVAIDGEHPQLLAMVPTPWLRQRIPVTVRITSGARTTTAIVWASASAPSPGPVYAADQPRGSAGKDVVIAAGTIDRARTRGVPAPEDGVRDASRLRRAVRAGEPALATDFEPLPLVQAQQPVAIQAGGNGVQLSVAGVALADGAAGDWIPVRWAGGDRPLHARIINHEVVRIEQ